MSRNVFSYKELGAYQCGYLVDLGFMVDGKGYQHNKLVFEGGCGFLGWKDDFTVISTMQGNLLNPSRPASS